MKKRGQFYLIAALIIVLIFSSLTYVYTSAKEKGNNEIVYDLADEIHFEGNQIIDNYVSSGNSDYEIASALNNTLADYYSKKHQNKKLIMVYGNTGGAYIINGTYVEFRDPSLNGDIVNVDLDGTKRDVEILAGRQNFYVLIKIEDSGEKTIVVR